MKMKKCLFIILCGILLLAPGSQSLNAAPIVRVIPSPNTKLSWGDSVRVAITFDTTDDAAKIGAYDLLFMWDTNVLKYAYTSGGNSLGYMANNVNAANAYLGNIAINQYYAQGSSGKVNVANITFAAVGQYGSTSPISVIVRELYNATDFSDMKKTLLFENGSVAMNAYPVISSFSLPDAKENKSYKGYITIEDPDTQDTFTATLLTSPAWIKISENADDNTRFNLTGIPRREDIGAEFPVIIRVEDEGGLADTLSTSINVIDVNEPPLFVTSSLKRVFEYTPYADTLSAVDDDEGDKLVFDMLLGPEWLILQRETGVITGLLSPDAEETIVPVIFSVTDSGGLADTLRTQLIIKKIYNHDSYFMLDTTISNAGYQGGTTIDNPGTEKFIGIASYIFKVTKLRSFSIDITWESTKARYVPSRSGASVESDSYSINGIDTVFMPGEKNLLLSDSSSITSIGEINDEGHYSITWAKMGGESVIADSGLLYFAVFKTRSNEEFDIHFNARIYDDEGNETVLSEQTFIINKEKEIVVIEGDFDSDGKIGPSDFSIFASHFNMTNTNNNPDWLPNCDFNNDGKITASDFSLFAARYGMTGTTSKTALSALNIPSSDMNLTVTEHVFSSTNENRVTISFDDPSFLKGFELYVSYNNNAYALYTERISGLAGLKSLGITDSGVLRISDWFVDEPFRGAIEIVFEKLSTSNDDLSFTILNAVVDGQNGIENVTTITQNSQTIPIQSSLLQNYPNPFNLSTTIEFELPATGDVKVYVYNMEGQRICTLVDKTMTAGLHTAMWNGLNENGEVVGSGHYIYQLTIDGYSITKKMTLLK